MRIFLSYHTPDRLLALAVKNAVEHAIPGSDVFVDQTHLRHGQFWQPALFEAIESSDAFLILVGTKLGDWQFMEYCQAQDRKAKNQAFPLLPVLITDRSKGAPANLPGLSMLHWIEATEPTSPPALSKIVAALTGHTTPEVIRPWRTINPYRGLLALQEQDVDFFFGRETETASILGAIASRHGKLFALIGNSGVGKSSLMQAGVIGSLKRQQWPSSTGTWPPGLDNSRGWAYLNFRPGEDPILALVSAFIGLWFATTTDPERYEHRNRWAELLRSDGARLSDLIDATEARFRDELGLSPPRRLLLYIDQGEELYTRCSKDTIKQFSELLAGGLSDRRLVALTSIRADFYGYLQANEALFPNSERIDVPPLGSIALASVLREPARVLGVKFESDQLVDLIVASTADQAGALPLLADFMTDLWDRMQTRDDGVLRVSEKLEIIQVGASLTRRADRFLEQNPGKLEDIKRLFTLKLVTVPEAGEPVRRRVGRDEWNLIQELSGSDWRLLVTAESDGRVTGELAHEILLSQWKTLRAWIEDQRAYLVWRGVVERSRRAWVNAPAKGKAEALLMGLPLTTAQQWLVERAAEISPVDQAYIKLSLTNRNKNRKLWRRILLSNMLGLSVLLVGYLYMNQYKDWLVDAKVDSLTAQGEIIAQAIAGNATFDSESIVLDPDNLPENSRSLAPFRDAALSFSIRPEKITPILRRLLQPEVRARVFDHDAKLVVDSANVVSSGTSYQATNQVAEARSETKTFWTHLTEFFIKSDLPVLRDRGPSNGYQYPPVRTAMTGLGAPMLLLNEEGQQIVAYAAPIRRALQISGVLLLSTEPGEIEKVLTKERDAILRLSALALLSALVSTFLLVRTLPRI